MEELSGLSWFQSHILHCSLGKALVSLAKGRLSHPIFRVSQDSPKRGREEAHLPLSFSGRDEQALSRPENGTLRRLSYCDCPIYPEHPLLGLED